MQKIAQQEALLQHQQHHKHNHHHSTQESQHKPPTMPHFGLQISTNNNPSQSYSLSPEQVCALCVISLFANWNVVVLRLIGDHSVYYCTIFNNVLFIVPYISNFPFQSYLLTGCEECSWTEHQHQQPQLCSQGSAHIANELWKFVTADFFIKQVLLCVTRASCNFYVSFWWLGQQRCKRM